MRTRLLILAGLTMLLAITVTGLEIVESRMERSAMPAFKTPAFQAPENAPTGLDSALVGTGEPVDPVLDPYQWQRENQYLMLEQARRIGWGPDIKAQIPTPPAVDPVRIVVIGDSFVWGQGAEDLDMRWDRVLERELNRRTAPDTFEVVALGKGASSTMNEAEWMTDARLKALKPDAMVVGFITNDYWPTFTEGHFCKKLNLCAPDDGAPSANCGPRCDLAACLLGDGSPFGWAMRDVLNPRYPNVTSWLLNRYCDPDRINARRGLLQERQIDDDPTTTEYWPLFKEAVRQLGAAGGDIPHFVVHSRTRPFIADSRDASEILFLDNGFTLVDLPATYNALAKRDKSELTVNPADHHPSSVLTYAYAADAASAILKRFAEHPTVVKNKSKQGSQGVARLLVSNFLPTSMYPTEMSTKTAVLAFDPEAARDQMISSSAEVNGKKFPSQYAPCARMGRPHARVMLDPTRDASTTVELTLQQGPTTMVVMPVGYAKDGTPLSSAAFTLAVGERHRLELNGLTGFLIGGPSAGCANDDELTLPGFVLRVSAV